MARLHRPAPTEPEVDEVATRRALYRLAQAYRLGDMTCEEAPGAFRDTEKVTATEKKRRDRTMRAHLRELMSERAGVPVDDELARRLGMTPSHDPTSLDRLLTGRWGWYELPVHDQRMLNPHERPIRDPRELLAPDHPRNNPTRGSTA